MNNANLLIDDEEELIVDTTSVLRDRQVKLLKIVTAIDNLSKNEDWQSLKGLIFDGMVEKLESNLQSEAKKNELNNPEIYRLQGQLAWAKRYADIYKLAETYKLEINNITKKLNENATI